MLIIKKIKIKRKHKLIVMQWNFGRTHLRRKAWITWQPIRYKSQEEFQQFKAYLMIHNDSEEMREIGGCRKKATKLISFSNSTGCHSV